jgi:hypothetical protein
MTCCFINYYISWYCIFLFTNSIVNNTGIWFYTSIVFFFVKKLQYWNNFLYQYCQQYWYTSIVIAKYRRSICFTNHLYPIWKKHPPSLVVIIPTAAQLYFFAFRLFLFYVQRESISVWHWISGVVWKSNSNPVRVVIFRLSTILH